MSVIELDKLTVRLGSRTVLSDLSCRLESRAIGLLGPNGAGKSTLIRTLLGFHTPVSGSGRVLGLDVATQGREIRSLIGYMPESDAFISRMSAVRFVRYMAELHGLPSADAMERAHEALFWVGLGEERYRNLETFSLGMKQRVKLAQAIVHGPRLVLLDEPTNGLDPPGRAHMLRLVRELQSNEEVCVVISSHLLPDVESVSDHVIILKDGRVAADTDLEAQRGAQHRYVELELFADEAANEAFAGELARSGWEHAPAGAHRVKVVLPREASQAALFEAADRAGAVIRRYAQRRDTLQDLFLRAMGLDPAEALRAGA